MARNRFFGLSQYKAPFSYELGGKSFHFIMDDGREYSFEFIDGETLRVAQLGQPFIFEKYECLKGDDNTYFVHIAPAAFKGKVNHSWIIDVAQNLVTMVEMQEDLFPDLQRLIKVTPYFGAIKIQGRPLPEIRHTLYNEKAVGRHVKWHYNPASALEHVYKTTNAYGICYGRNGETVLDVFSEGHQKEIHSDDENVRNMMEQMLARFRKRVEFYPVTEEPCFHIRINDELNLFCFVEENMLRRDPNHSMGGGGLLLLQNIDRLVDVGLSYAYEEYYMVTAYGEEQEPDEVNDSKPNRYDWSVLEAMPSIRWGGKIEK